MFVHWRTQTIWIGPRIADQVDDRQHVVVDIHIHVPKICQAETAAAGGVPPGKQKARDALARGLLDGVESRPSLRRSSLKARTGRVCNKIERSALLSLVTHACHGFRAAEVRPFTKDGLQRDGVIVVSAKRKKVKQPQ